MITLFLFYTLRRLFFPGKQSKLPVQTFRGLKRKMQVTTQILLPLVAFLLIHVMVARSQPLNYSVMYHGKCIGQLDLNREAKSDSIVYTLHSTAEISLLLKFRVITSQRSLYYRNTMVSYQLLQKVNGRIRQQQAGSWNGSGYVLTCTKGIDKFHSQAINYCVASMYYVEPLQRCCVFAEFNQQTIFIHRIAAHTYILESANGDKTVFEYNGGVCSKVTVETQWATVEFRLNKEFASTSK